MDPDLLGAIDRLLASEELLHLPVFSPDSGDAADPAPDNPGVSQIAGRIDLREQELLLSAIKTRVYAISFAIHNTLTRQRAAVLAGVDLLERWIADREIVRVIGAGRALHAASIPANRLAHAGANVHVINDVVPLPNSSRGGGILAASASGKTRAVLEIMESARALNPDITILGIAHRDAEDFAKFCDIFIGIEEADNPYKSPLHALADTGEYVISELLDAMVVAAGKLLGLSEEDFRLGHEDLGPTGPYRPRRDGPSHAE